MRHTYMINWIEKPFAVWRIIEPIANKKMERSLDVLPNWYKTKKNEYLVGLE